ncbi:HD domain-containing protein [Fluoribacter dumoffii]|nr:HD domain-containing protein [Fluoribacter dumoffii]MCW8384707.1 HD domain-containing protein [Fluoribacter dumoffii]MCW8417771.1 HD domain-containing protein [Fluoribacter dumoffii]MCW8454387.1 HD domain-containing protein [Fluoribacter dumoffii]MCW8461539.1 HD domain-containing protein [Fluoribacter dumoffii]MCW8496893.1 HD domain-containing protein [Fluoribacter dumoffii]
MNAINQKIERAFQYLRSAKKMDYIGEPISQLEHALQCAYFAEQAGHSEEIVLACLFHDIGHFAGETKQNRMADLGIVLHEWIGASLAYELGFSAKIALLIGNHVNAKRYLAGRKKDYFERLSEASKKTLLFQGGVMSAEEMFCFEANIHFKDVLRVRVNDEKAKETGLKVPELDYYRPYLYSHFERTIHPEGNITVPDFIDAQWVERFRTFLEKQAEVDGVLSES